MEKKITVNLIPKKKVSLAERFIFWLINIGRYIIISTELVVFIVFISRFQLDLRLSDLTDKIKQEEAIVKSLEEVDKSARILHIRLSEIKKLMVSAQEKNPLTLLSTISSLTPPTIAYEVISQQKEVLRITAVGSSSREFSLFVQNLRSAKQLRNVTVSEVSKDDKTGGIRFTISAIIATESAVINR